MPPRLHVHHTEDQIFPILEGEFYFQLGQEEPLCQAGTILLVAKGMAYTCRVEFPPGGRWLTVTAHTDFECFVRAMGRPAEKQDLHPAAAPLPKATAALTATASDFGIELVEPPLA